MCVCERVCEPSADGCWASVFQFEGGGRVNGSQEAKW